MTNQELLEIIKTARETSVNVDTLRRVLKIVEQDGEISTKKVNQIKGLFQKGNINDEELLNILEKAYQKRISWDFFLCLNNHRLIKNYLNKINFNKEEWKIILEFVSKLPENIVIDSIYVKWLKYIYEQEEIKLDELQFFHKVFKKSINTPLIHSDWYFNYLLDKKKPLKNRNNVLTLLEQNIFNIAREIIISEIDTKTRKIIKCFELYGYKFANLYATIITCIVDMDMPIIKNDKEIEVYKSLYIIMCYINDNLGINFKNSKFYKLATNEEVAPEKRLEFITIICSKNLVLKDELVEELWEIYEEKESDILIELKFAFLNKDIRTNRLCKSFLLNETDLKVLKLARRVFRNNRVRKDKKNLRILCDLKTSEEKTTFLCFLENKYQDDIEVKRSKERERKEKEQALLKAYQAFLNNKVGLAKLEESLNSSEDLTINLTRRKKNYEGRI